MSDEEERKLSKANQLNGNIPIDVVWLPRPSSDYSGCFPLGFEKYITELLKCKEDEIIHLFSGKSEVGHTVDIKEELNPKLVADVHDLPIEDSSFKGAMADPPYTEEFAEKLYGVKMPRWGEWTEEMVRVVKPGGRIGVMHNYVVPRLPKCEYVRLFVIITRIKQYPKIVTIQTKKQFEEAE